MSRDIEVRAQVTVAIRDETGQRVKMAADLRTTPEGPVFVLETPPLTPGVREAIFRVIVTEGERVLSEHTHTHRFTLTDS